MKKINKLLSALLAIVLALTGFCLALVVNATAANTFTLSTSYQDGVIADDATQIKFEVKFDVENSYGFVGGDFTLDLPDKINSIAQIKVTENTKLGGGTSNNSLISIATKNNKIRFIADDAKTSLKSISFEITLNVVSELERGENYEIRLSVNKGDFKDNQTQNAEIEFDTNTKSISVHLRREAAAKPLQPAKLEVTDTTVKLIPGTGYEYRCNDGAWQKSNVFEGLQPNTQYRFYQRVAESASQFASEPSDPSLITTDKSKATKPAIPTVASKTTTSITLTKIDGYEYKRDNGAWQTSNVFTGLKADTEYYFYQRKAATDTHYASESSSRLIEKTNAITSNVPNKITSSKYSVGSNTVSKIAAGTTVSSFLNGINEKQYCKVYKGNTVVSGDKQVGSGMTVKLMDGNTVKASYTIIVTGDVNGDGGITVTDMIAVKAAILKKSSLSGAYKTAADTNGDGNITITDFIQIKAKILGKGNIVAR